MKYTGTSMRRSPEGKLPYKTRAFISWRCVIKVIQYRKGLYDFYYMLVTLTTTLLSNWLHTHTGSRFSSGRALPSLEVLHVVSLASMLYTACMSPYSPPQDRYGAKDYTKALSLKTDHSARPLWVVRTSSKENKNASFIIILGSGWSHFPGGFFSSVQACKGFPHSYCSGEWMPL